MMDTTILQSIITTTMPYGKYKGRLICDLPEFYLIWYKNKGFPNGKLGEQLGLVYEIKLNGLDYLIENLKKLK